MTTVTMGEQVEMVELKLKVEKEEKEEEEEEGKGEVGEEEREGNCFQWQDTLVREVAH